MNSHNYKHLQQYHQERNTLNERLNKYGHEALLDEEIIHYLTGIAVTKVKDSITKHGLKEIIKYIESYELTKPQKKKLEMLFEFEKRLSIAPYKEKSMLDSSSKSGEFFLNELKFESNEKFIVAFLDAQNRLISKETPFVGTLTETAVYPRTIIYLALKLNANSVIVGHNHPGGSLKPSSADIETTKRLSTALSSISIKLIDHVIIGEGEYFSFAEKGLL